MPATLGGDVVVAYDRTAASRNAAAYAASRAEKTGESVDIVHVGTNVSTKGIEERVGREFDRRGVDLTVETISSAGAEHDNVEVSRELTAFVRDHSYEMVVMGNERHDRLYAATQASVSGNLIDEQSVPVVLVGASTPVGPGVEFPDGLLVPYDDTGPAEDAATFAAERAARTGESVDVVHVGSGLSTGAMRDAVGDAFAARGVDVSFETVSASGSDRRNVSVRKRLSDHVGDHDYRLVCMGNEKHGLFYRVLKRSVSKALIDDRTIPVVLVP